jgi:hypothetical protein
LRRELERVLALEQTGNRQRAAPDEGAIGLDANERGLDRNGALAERELQVELLADGELAACFLDERIPLGVRAEVGQHLPNALGRRIDDDFGIDLFHRGEADLRWSGRASAGGGFVGSSSVSTQDEDGSRAAGCTSGPRLRPSEWRT